MSHSFLTLHDLHTDRQQGRAGGAGGGGGGLVEVSGNQRWSGRATRTYFVSALRMENSGQPPDQYRPDKQTSVVGVSEGAGTGGS
jgi:hypothetical protein